MCYVIVMKPKAKVVHRIILAAAILTFFAAAAKAAPAATAVAQTASVSTAAAQISYDPEQAAAFMELNRLRTAAGLPAAAMDPSLTSAARAHALYYVTHASDSAMAGLGAHTEVPGTAGFTGATPLDRALHFGFSGQEVAEVMHFVPTAEQAVEGWRDSVYHRLALLDPRLTKVGYGYAQAGSIWVNTMDLGGNADASGITAPVLYPYPGENNVPVDFDGNEIPNPLRNIPGLKTPVGYPITVQFGHLPVASISQVKAALYDQDGTAVDIAVLTPDDDSYLGSAIAVIPAHPLACDHVYTVRVHALLQENATPVPWSAEWTFRTSSYPVPRVQSIRWVTSGGGIRSVTLFGSGLGTFDRLYLGGAPATPVSATAGSVTYQVSPEAIGPQYDLLVVTPDWQAFTWQDAITLSGTKPPLPAPVTLVVDGQVVNAPVYQIAGRILVPLRAVAEGLQADVQWIGPSRRVYFQREDQKVSVVVNSLAATVDGRPAYLDVPPVLVADRTYVPVRFVAESLGARVDWDQSRRTVIVTTQ